MRVANKSMKKQKLVNCCPICGNVCPNCNLGGGACNCCDCVMPEDCEVFDEFCKKNKYADKDKLKELWDEYVNSTNLTASSK